MFWDQFPILVNRRVVQWQKLNFMLRFPAVRELRTDQMVELESLPCSTVGGRQIALGLSNQPIGSRLLSRCMNNIKRRCGRSSRWMEKIRTLEQQFRRVVADPPNYEVTQGYGCGLYFDSQGMGYKNFVGGC